MNSPIVVAGMHRSGTSLVASTLTALGISLGDQLLAADRGNPRGYFEDLGFLALNRRMLTEATRADDGGHRDWGWTESERLDRSRFEELREAALDLIAERAREARPWGWKDPRTTLLLDFWEGVLDDPTYLFVYRFPWEVADSMQRLGADVFLRHPDYAYRIWAFYNRHLLDFYRRHRDRSILVSADTLVRQPERFGELLGRRLGLGVQEMKIESLLAGVLFGTLEVDDPLISLAAASHPECASLLGELDSLADLPGTELWTRSSPSARKARPPGAGTRLAVVIPCYDHGEFLIEAVASVERSVPEPCELVIVNDGSREPRTLEVLDILRRAGYQVVDQENSGLAAARNRGFEETSAPYVLPLDSDNRLRPGFLGSALQILDDHPEVAAVYGDRRDFGLRWEVVDVPPFELDEILPFNFIDACAVLRKEAWKACGGYDRAMPIAGWEDWDLWLGVAERGWQIHHLPRVAFDYRVRPDSMVSAMTAEEVRRRLYTYVISKHRGIYWQRLPEILLAAQRSAGELFRLAREHERLHTEANAALRAQAAGLESAAEALKSAEEELKSAEEKRASLEREIGALRAERERLYAELTAWSERVAFMESTRAWSLRQWIVDLKRALGRLFSSKV